VLPTAIANAPGIRVLAEPVLAPSQLFLVRRQPLGPTALDPVVEAIRERARGVLSS
jgi:hypothetical protein